VKTKTRVPHFDREARVAELRRLVQTGQYQVAPQEVAASIIRESEKPEPTPPKPNSKTANNGS